jgi:sulfatase modifying factor 1
MTNCTRSGGTESCCASIEVTGGTFYRTYTNTTGVATGEKDPATVSSFRLDKYLVTVGRFRQFVTAWNGGSGYEPAAGSGKHTHLNGGSGLAAVNGGYEPGWVAADDSNLALTTFNLLPGANEGTWTTTAGTQELLPMSRVNWYEAYAFCIWDGGFLPSEAELEYAAAGGSQQREDPWGTFPMGTPNGSVASFNCNYGGNTSTSPSASSACTGTSSGPAAEGTVQGVGLWGQLDLSGNMNEWNLDWYDGFFAYGNPCTDCAQFVTGTNRLKRGGGWDEDQSFLNPWVSRAWTSTFRDDDVGFRCARVP